MAVFSYLDTILVPLSLFFTIGYHAYLWNSFRRKPSFTAFGVETLKRRSWFQDMEEGDDKKGMLAVQSLRNALMGTILSATISILMNIALAALTNNSYKASHFLNGVIFGSQSSRMMVLKYGSASFFLLGSFLCSSLALWNLIDANFLINARGDFAPPGYTKMIFERGILLSVVGNRMLCMTFPLLLWLFGPVPVVFSSGVLIWGLYELDFRKQFHKNH